MFGKLDWVANGVLFALYHIHQPWTWAGILSASLVFAYTGKRFRSNWFPIVLHSLQSVFLVVVILGVLQLPVPVLVVTDGSQACDSI